MIPRWHILSGLIFTILIFFIAPNTPIYNLVTLFLSTFLIDVDHYVVGVYNTKSPSLKKAIGYNNKKNKLGTKEREKGIKNKGDFHLFHTIEFHLFIGLLGLIYLPFFYVFIGLVFHSLSDLVYLFKKGDIYRREFFLINWLIKRKN